MSRLLAGSTDGRLKTKKATADLRAHNQPDVRFPLSSPATDDDISTDEEVMSKEEKLAALNETTQSLPRRNDDRARRPNITVNTNLPLDGRRPAPKKDGPRPRQQEISKQAGTQKAGFVTLGDLTTAATKNEPTQRSRWRLRRKDRQLELQEAKDLDNVGGASAHDIATTPSILVTPAREEFAPRDTERREKSTRPRARSSIYSQPSPNIYGDPSENVPPLPTATLNPGLLKRSLNPFLSPTRTERESIISRRLGRSRESQTSDHALSAIEPSAHSHGRPRSLSAQPADASFDTLAAQHLSRGWWNVILSPFVTWSSTSSKSDAFPSPPPMPDIHNARLAHGAAQERGIPPTSSVSPVSRVESFAWTDPASSASPREVSAVSHDRPFAWAAPTGTDPYRGLDHFESSQPHATHFEERGPRAGGDLVSIHNDRVSAPRGLIDQHQPEVGPAENAYDRSHWEGPSANDHMENVRHQRVNEAPAEADTPTTLPTASSKSPDDMYQGRSRDRRQSDSDWPQPPPYSPPRSADRHPRRLPRPPPALTSVSYTRGQRSDNAPAALPRAVNERYLREETPTIVNQTTYQRVYQDRRNQESSLPPRPPILPVTMREIERPSQRREQAQYGRRRAEKQDYYTERWEGPPREGGKRGCCGRRSRRNQSAAEKKKRRCCFICLTIALLIMIGVILALVLTLTRKPKNVEATPSQWLNITGWPPIPTGVATIAQPDAAVENSGCIFPKTKWSCAVPKEQQKSILPNAPDQPDFRVQILFRNDSTTNTTLFHDPQRRSFTRILRDGFLTRRDAASDASWASSPPAPPLEEQRFMGNTTDNIKSSLKEGEVTPFYISFLSTTSTSQPPSLERRASPSRPSSASASASAFPNVGITIPPPDGSPDGTPSPADLLPFPANQPIRLYDRGLSTEHYGFYNYFDRSIFLSSLTLLNSSTTASSQTEDPADANGGASLQDTAWRCTWAQTRFLVQIWTRRLSESPLLPNGTASTASPGFKRPGTFPYPVTITLDRHGGDVTKKQVYCYGLDQRGGKLVATNRTIQIEDRGFGGALVGGGQGPLGKNKVTLEQGGLGGIDGGTGGCECSWNNFLGSGGT
ncbi:MAG: hypothetical protein M4579_006721 [Chaenotheca gracillima]|nr:MAG: hypothetical protein M4579_006721 [Chaenotheca gracillima]